MSGVEVNDDDLDDPELAAELAALAGEMGDSNIPAKPAPAPAQPVAAPAPAAPAPASGGGDATAGIDADIKRLSVALANSTKLGKEDQMQKISARIAKLQADKAALGAPVASPPAPAPAPAPPPPPAPAPAPAVDQDRVQWLDKQIMLRKKAGQMAKKQNDKAKMNKYLMEIKQLRAQKEQLEASAMRAAPPAPAPAPKPAAAAPPGVDPQFVVPEADVDSVQVDDEDMDDPELAAELAALAGEDGGAAPAPAPAPPPARGVDPQFVVPEADVGSVDVDDEDMDDPELAAELAAMTGEDGGAETVPVPVGVDADDDDDELAGELDDLTAADETEPAAPPPIAAVRAPAPPPAVAAQVPAGVTSEELEAEVKRIQAKMLEFAMVGEAPPAELVAQLKDAKARVEAFEAGPPPLDPSFIANPLDPSLIESNEVLASEKNRLTAEMMVFLEQGTVAPMSIVDVMKVIQFKIKTLEGEMEAGLDPQKYADRLQMAAERDDKIVAALRDTGRDEEAERVGERIVATRNEHAGVLAHILSLQGGGDDGEDADDADSGGLSDLEDEEEPAVDVQARIDEFDAQIKKLKQEALSLKKLGKIDEAKVPYRRMKQIEKNKETFLAGVGATQQLQKVAAQQRDDPDTIKRKLEQALKGAEEAARTGDEETKAKYMKQAQIFQAQWKEAKASVVTPVVPDTEAPPAEGDPPESTPPAQQQRTPRPTPRKELMDIYKQHNPRKLADVDRLISEWSTKPECVARGGVQTLLKKVRAKYGVTVVEEPEPEREPEPEPELVTDPPPPAMPRESVVPDQAFSVQQTKPNLRV